MLTEHSCSLPPLTRYYPTWSWGVYRDRQSNSTTFVMAPTIIFGNFRPCHCVQNSEIRPKPDFGGFPRGGQLLGRKIRRLIPDLGSEAAVPSVSQRILLPSDPSAVKTSSFDPSLTLPWSKCVLHRHFNHSQYFVCYLQGVISIKI